MKQFISFVRKEFYHIFRDARTTMILLLMPVILIILFGYAITTEIKRVPIAIFDQSRDELTLKMTDRLNASEYFELYTTVDSYEDAGALFRQGKVHVIVVFPPGYASTADAQVQVLADATDPNEATQLIAYCSAIIAEQLKGESAVEGSRDPGYHFALQPSNERCLQLRARRDGFDLDPYMCHDDLDRHREREGDGNDGSPAGLPVETHLHHSAQGDPIPIAEYGEYRYDLAAILFPAGRSDKRQPAVAGFRIHPVCDRIPLSGPADLHGSRYPAGGYVDQRYRLDASDHVVERHDVPDREYAGYPAMVLPYRSGQMVYHRREGRDDQGASRRVDLEGDRDTVVHGGRAGILECETF